MKTIEEVKNQTKILKALGKILNAVETERQPEITDESLRILDNANVLLIIAKTKPAKELLRKFIDKDNNLTKEFKIDESAPNGFSKYSTEYLRKALDIFKYDRAVKIFTAQDYPIVLENWDFKVIIAPRITD